MEYSARLEAMATIGRLVEDGQTFDPADAERLAELLPPPQRRSFFGFKLQYQGPGSRLSGRVAGVGDVGMRQDVDWSATNKKEVRIGSWVVSRNPDINEIADMWSDTNPGKDGRSAGLCSRTAAPSQWSWLGPWHWSSPFPSCAAPRPLW